MLTDVHSHDSITAAQSFLLVAPAAASRHFFANFTRVVNDYLEQPPFNFKNTHKHLGVFKKVSTSDYCDTGINVKHITLKGYVDFWCSG